MWSIDGFMGEHHNETIGQHNIYEIMDKLARNKRIPHVNLVSVQKRCTCALPKNGTNTSFQQ